MKKFLPFLILFIASIALVICFSFSAKAYTEGMYTYTVFNGEATITDCNNSISGEVTIPSSFGEYPVVFIGDLAFYGCNKVSSISIPNTVHTIGESAFYGCENLISIIIPDSITTIKSWAFLGCNNLKEVHITNLSNWCNIDFDDYGSNPISYGGDFFINNSKITDFKIPDDITHIKDWSFYAYSGISVLEIPYGVTEIGESAFSDCINISNIKVPSSVIRIKNGAFFNNKVVSISLPFIGESRESNKYLGHIFGSKSHTNSYVPNTLKEIKILDGCNEIPAYAFNNCRSIVQIQIPQSVTSIGEKAFYECNKLNSINLTNNIISIGDYAFYNCVNISNIEIPSSVINIGFGILYKCNSLEYIKLPFDQKYNIIGKLFGSNDRTNNNTYVPETLKRIIVAEGSTIIGDSAFYNCDSISTIEFPSTLTNIQNDAFIGCSSLSDVYIPNITAWCSIKFEYISSNPMNYGAELYINNIILTNIEFPENLEYIEPWAFSGCETLESISIPNSIKEIGAGAFYNCNNLTKINLPNNLQKIEASTFYGCSKLANIIIPDSVVYIGYQAFSGCSNIEQLILPINLEVISEKAFYGCDRLVKINLPEKVTEINKFVFTNCHSLQSITLPQHLERISYMTFNGCETLQRIYYKGDIVQWKHISIDSGNECISNTILHFNYNETSNPFGKTVSLPFSNIPVTKDDLKALFNDELITIDTTNIFLGTGNEIVIRNEEVKIIVKGDIDGDGVATVFDALIVKKALANNGFENESLREFAGDVDGTSGTTEADVSAILSHIVGNSFVE